MTLLSFLRIALIFLALGILLWVVSLHPARQHPGLEKLRRYRYAHRGYHNKPTIPENSMAAFRRAAERGFGVELDVHLTKDGRLAVIHDASPQRTCGTEGFVEDFTAEELAAFRLEGTDECIPFLEEVLPLFEGVAPLIVELKPFRGNHARLAKAATECLDRFRADYCMENFDPRCVYWLKKNRPEIIRGQLSENFIKRKGTLSPINRFLMTHLLFSFANRPDFVAYAFDDRHCIANRIACGLWNTAAVSWTIRSRKDMLQAEAEGAMVIFEQFDPEEVAE